MLKNKKPGIESFETKRMKASRICLDDFDDLNNLHKNKEVMKTLGGIRSIEQNREYLHTSLKHWEDYGFGLWIFRTKEGQFIGRGGIRHVEIENNDQIEVAYSLLPQYWGKGFATEIAKASIQIAFEIYLINNLICFTQTTNIASRKVMEKVGFQYEKELILYNEPHVIYRLEQTKA